MNEYNDFEKAMSASRLRRYLDVCSQNEQRALNLYRANIRLSGKFLQVICVVEVALRNAIDRHYLKIYGDDWVVSQTNPKGYLAKPGCERSRATAQKAINELGIYYSHDRTIAELGFGFWRYAFGERDFEAAGSTLLNIFLRRPRGIGQKIVLERLGYINDIRNRIAHHDPICFEGNTISTRKIELAYHSATDFLDWLALNRAIILEDVDFVLEEIAYISKI